MGFRMVREVEEGQFFSSYFFLKEDEEGCRFRILRHLHF